MVSLVGTSSIVLNVLVNLVATYESYSSSDMAIFGSVSVGSGAGFVCTCSVLLGVGFVSVCLSLRDCFGCNVCKLLSDQHRVPGTQPSMPRHKGGLCHDIM